MTVTSGRCEPPKAGWLVTTMSPGPSGCRRCTSRTQTPRAPRCTGMCGALITRVPRASRRAQEKSARSLTLVETAVGLSASPIWSTTDWNRLRNNSTSTAPVTPPGLASGRSGRSAEGPGSPLSTVDRPPGLDHRRAGRGLDHLKHGGMAETRPGPPDGLRSYCRPPGAGDHPEADQLDLAIRGLPVAKNLLVATEKLVFQFRRRLPGHREGSLLTAEPDPRRSPGARQGH